MNQSLQAILVAVSPVVVLQTFQLISTQMGIKNSTKLAIQLAKESNDKKDLIANTTQSQLTELTATSADNKRIAEEVHTAVNSNTERMQRQITELQNQLSTMTRSDKEQSNLNATLTEQLHPHKESS